LSISPEQSRGSRIKVVASKDSFEEAWLEAMGTAPKLMSPDEFAAFTRSEKERWARIIHRANIKVE